MAAANLALHQHPVMSAIRDRICRELSTVADRLKSTITQPPFSQILQNLDKLLEGAARLLESGEIDPSITIRTSPVQGAVPVRAARVRIGFYPVAANPFHWGHLLIGLAALVRYRLSSVVYIISGEDPRKPSLISPERRHSTGRKILSLFAPLFSYSDVALGDNLDGEANLFKILSLNPRQKTDAFYIAGSDHYHRINPLTGELDTIQRLEDNIRAKRFGYDDSMHRVAAVFVKRDPIPCLVPTSLDVSFIPELPFAASSTMIRNAFLGREPADTLALLPHIAFALAGAFRSPARQSMSGDNAAGIPQSAAPAQSTVTRVA